MTTYMCRFCGGEEERDRSDPCTKCGGWRMLEKKWVEHRENTVPKPLTLNVQHHLNPNNYVAHGRVEIWAGDCPIIRAKHFCYVHHLDDDIYANYIAEVLRSHILALEHPHDQERQDYSAM